MMSSGKAFVVRREDTVRPTDIVDTHHEDHRVGVRMDVAIEASQGIDAHSIAQHLGARDA